MLLRASSQQHGIDLNMKAVVGEQPSGLAHGDVLAHFVLAVLDRDRDDLPAQRDAVAQALGDDAVAAVAGVISMFTLINRVADACGIPLDSVTELATQKLREDLGLNEYGTAANTPQSGVIRKALGRLAEPLIPRLLSFAGRRHQK